MPETGPLGPLNAAANQLLTFSPIIFLPLYRRASLDTACLPLPHLVARLGVALAAITVTVYALLRAGACAPWEVASRIVSYERVDEAAQVFVEM